MMAPKRPSVLVSVATASHAAALKTLWSSLAQHTHRHDHLVIGLGHWPRELVPEQGFVAAEDLLSKERLSQLATRYTAAELCFYLKPVALTHALNEGYDSAHYLDTDLWCLDSWDPATELGDANVLLTPHLHTRTSHADPASNAAASQQLLTLLRAGLYNAGYVGVRNTTTAQEFLQWWQARLDTHGDIAPYLGMNGDQRWLDAAPLLFPGVQISADPGVNAGYWSDAEITTTSGGYRIGGAALRLFHFSGFDPNHPEDPSSHSPTSAPSSTVKQLQRLYAGALINNGWSEQQAALPAPGKMRSVQAHRLGRLGAYLLRRVFRRTAGVAP